MSEVSADPPMPRRSRSSWRCPDAERGRDAACRLGFVPVALTVTHRQGVKLVTLTARWPRRYRNRGRRSAGILLASGNWVIAMLSSVSSLAMTGSSDYPITRFRRLASRATRCTCAAEAEAWGT